MRTVLAALLLAALLAPTAQAATTVTDIDVAEDGDARWVVEIREQLDTPAEERGFEELSSRVEESNSTQNFRDRLSATVAQASERTGRTMSIEDFEADAEVKGLSSTVGVVRYTFAWNGFARPGTNSDLSVGDAIEGYYVSEGDALRVAPPQGYEVTGVEPSPDATTDGAISWEGPQSFGPGEPRLHLAPSAGSPGDGVTANDAPAGEGHPEGEGQGTPSPLAIATVAVAAVLVAALIFERTGTTPTAIVEEASITTPGGGGRTGGTPMPDEDRVLTMLRQNDGRMRQAAVAEETGWSAAKVSNVTNALKRKGEIEKQRWGRENVLILDDGQ